MHIGVEQNDRTGRITKIGLAAQPFGEERILVGILNAITEGKQIHIVQPGEFLEDDEVEQVFSFEGSQEL